MDIKVAQNSKSGYIAQIFGHKTCNCGHNRDTKNKSGHKSVTTYDQTLIFARNYQVNPTHAEVYDPIPQSHTNPAPSS
jgi:hypothetical protein